MKYTYHITGIFAIAAYLLLFTAGLVIDSSPFRAQLNSSVFSFYTLGVVALTYTPINVAFLSVFAGLIAGCASTITYRKGEAITSSISKKQDPIDHQSFIFRTESPIASMFRSLVVYFGFMAGILVTTVQPFTATTPEQYVRLAAAISFFSFAVGYDPTKLQGLLRIPTTARAADK